MQEQEMCRDARDVVSQISRLFSHQLEMLFIKWHSPYGMVK